ncbi:hypothetical protein PAXRUDRAFT_172432 [Paxillus rubicundulus Ve08.2h10]|uniref:Unplaced genomic scaffold scaffold_3193, whole genome shotgun sequence n=1 Tax=Paxillus rubicundulus Ve08.2h10 TaxID=930991 RepID=A0A0D0DDQ9_9AGAM|nr:hypothetical protein PAXRUDRAFT_172432 [Paxillus rubicundulus Ve08.2h10]
MVYNAEVVGMMLAAHFLLTYDKIELPIAIYVDTQAAIESSDAFSTKPGHYLIDHFYSMINELHIDL